MSPIQADEQGTRDHMFESCVLQQKMSSKVDDGKDHRFGDTGWQLDCQWESAFDSNMILHQYRNHHHCFRNL